MKKQLRAILLLGLSASPAFAAAPVSPFYCMPLTQVFSSVGYCFENEHYEQASSACLEKLDRDVLQTRNTLASSFRGNDAASVTAQNSKLTNQEKNLSRTNLGLKGLLARSRQARAELVNYQRNMIYPGRPTEGFVHSFQLDAHLATFSCFREPFENVGRKISELDRKIAELERTDSKTIALFKDTSGDNRNLQRIQRNPGSVANTVAKGASVKGSSAAPSSTITGEIQKTARK